MAELIQRTFTSGELAPAVRARADLSKYMSGLALCQNMIVRSQGGVYNRPGLRHIGPTGRGAAGKARLIPFSFNTEQTYILVFEHQVVRFIKDGGYILQGTQNITGITQANPPVVTVTGHGYSTGDLVYIAGTGGSLNVNGQYFRITAVDANSFSLDATDGTNFLAYTSGGTVARVYSVATPYTEAQLPRIGFTQSADVLTLVHPAHDPRNLSRLADDNWTLTTINYASTLGVPTGLTISTVGTDSTVDNKTYRYVVTAVDADGVESLQSAPVSSNVSALSTTWGLKIEWTAVSGAVKYRVYKDPSLNTDIFGWIGDTETLEFSDFNIAPVTSDTPPVDRQPFNGAGNKPSTVGYYQQRQVFANTQNEPQVVYTTQTANFRSLRTSEPARDDDAVTFGIAAQQVNEIRHIVTLNAMILLTSGGGWLVSEGQDEVLTPASVGVRLQTYAGASWVRPATVEDTILYVQEKGTKVRDLNYEFSTDKYQGNDLSIMATHLFEGYQLLELAYANEPYGVMWCVRDDGRMLGFTYQREHQVWGWHQHETDGEFESVAVIDEDNRDAVYVVVKREINGVTQRYVERMEPRFDDDAVDAFFVDSGLSYNGSPVTTIYGLLHLEGEEVSVLADGNVVLDLVVENGSITLPRESSKVHVGLPYAAAMETLDIDTPSAMETLKHASLSVAKVTLEVEKSRGGWVGPKLGQTTVGTMREIKPRFESDGYNTIALKTFKAEIFIEPEWAKTGGLRIEQRAPLPFAVLSVIPDVTVGG